MAQQLFVGGSRVDQDDLSADELVQPHTSTYHAMTAGLITARSLLVLIETMTWEMTLFTQNTTSISHSGSSWGARKKLAGTLTWKQTLLSRHQKKPNLACTYALPFSCFHAFCVLLLAALVIDLGCLPFVLAPWSHQRGHARDFYHILYFPYAVCCACLAAQLGCLGKRVAATVADFVIISQLYLVKTQARPAPLRSSRAIQLPSCHTFLDRLDLRYTFPRIH